MSLDCSQFRKYQRCNRCSCTGAQTPSGKEKNKTKTKHLSRIATGPVFVNEIAGGGSIISGLSVMMSRVSSPLWCVCSWALWAEPMHVYLPGLWELSYRNIPNNGGAFICFNHLTDQTFIWDQAAIWNRRLILSSQKSGLKMSQSSPAFRWTLWHPSAIEDVSPEEKI